jgi:hypothetical protein
MTAVFDPFGIWGRAYWFMIYPFHYLVFNGMFRGLVQAIERNKRECEALKMQLNPADKARITS